MNQRNAKLLEERYSNHPLRSDVQNALESAERFAAKAASIRQNKDLSQEGKTNAVKSQLRAALRDVRDAGAPVAEMKERLNAIQASISIPKFDKADMVGALGRQEIRQALRGMSLGDRAGLLLGDGADPRWIDAVLEQPPLLSGTPPELYDQAKVSRLESLFQKEIAQGEDLDQQISEGDAALTIARQDVARAADLPEHEFNKISEEIESKKNAVWLRREKDIHGNETVVVVPLKGGAARLASAEEAREGKYYPNHAAWLADRAAQPR
jgi:uncharacterized protein YdaT